MADSRTHPHADMPPEDELARIIVEKHPKHHDLYLGAHRLVLRAAPEVRYSVDLVDGVIGYGARQYGYGGWGMAALSPHKGWVSLVLFRAGELDDPDGLLEGTGALVRHVKLRTVEQLAAGRESLKRLLEGAASINQK